MVETMKFMDSGVKKVGSLQLLREKLASRSAALVIGEKKRHRKAENDGNCILPYMKKVSRYGSSLGDFL